MHRPKLVVAYVTFAKLGMRRKWQTAPVKNKVFSYTNSLKTRSSLANWVQFHDDRTLWYRVLIISLYVQFWRRWQVILLSKAFYLKLFPVAPIYWTVYRYPPHNVPHHVYSDVVMAGCHRGHLCIPVSLWELETTTWLDKCLKNIFAHEWRLFVLYSAHTWSNASKTMTDIC